MVEDAVERVARALKDLRHGGLALPDPSAAAKEANALVREVPSWVSHFDLVEDVPCAWLFAEPDAAVAYDRPGQLVLDFPVGRYMIDTFDLAARKCVARESASASPLVIGFTYTGAPTLLWIRKMR